MVIVGRSKMLIISWSSRLIYPKISWKKTITHFEYTPTEIYYYTHFISNKKTLYDFPSKLPPNSFWNPKEDSPLKKFLCPSSSFFKFIQNTIKNNIRGFSSIDSGMESALLVIINQRWCLLVISFQTLR